MVMVAGLLGVGPGSTYVNTGEVISTRTSGVKVSNIYILYCTHQGYV